jgi:hypothetical protein
MVHWTISLAYGQPPLTHANVMKTLDARSRRIGVMYAVLIISSYLGTGSAGRQKHYSGEGLEDCGCGNCLTPALERALGDSQIQISSFPRFAKAPLRPMFAAVPWPDCAPPEGNGQKTDGRAGSVPPTELRPGRPILPKNRP